MTPPSESPLLSRKKFDAVIFDLDGVITRSARVHAKSWKGMFDAFLSSWARRHGVSQAPFDPVSDYRPYVDGKPRYEGVSGFLKTRGIVLPYGSPEDSPETETVCGLGNRKNVLFKAFLLEEGVEVFPTSVELLKKLRRVGMKIGLVSSSKNCLTIIEKAGLVPFFDARVDGVRAAKEALKGKPEPETFLQAARDLNVPPERAVVVEDALVGVAAGRKGKFGWVVGVDRVDQTEALRANGADVVVKDLGELRVEGAE